MTLLEVNLFRTQNPNYHRNKTQFLIMIEIVKCRDLFFKPNNKIYLERWWGHYFKLKNYLFTKYKIKTT